MRRFSAYVFPFVLLGLPGAACSQTELAKEPAEKESVLAVVNGVSITAADLDIEGKLLQLRQQEYELRRGGLEEAIEARLLEQEAGQRGVSVEALLDEEVNSKVADPTDVEVETFYERRKSRIRRPLEDVREQVKDVLKQANAQQVRDRFVAGLREKGEVETYLDPPRLPVDLSEAPLRGPADAPVTIVEFSDFQCPFCKKVQPVLNQLADKYGDQIRWSFKDLPLTGIHPGALRAAEASRCAGDQGKFWEYRSGLFDAGRVTNDLHPKLGESLGLDMESFQSCLASEKYREAVQADGAEAEKLGITGTPAFLVNGILLPGARPFEAFIEIIDRELQRR